MKQHFSFPKIVFGLVITTLILCFSAFSQEQKANQDSFKKGQLSKDNDTSTSTKHDRNEDNWNADKLDNELRHLDFEMNKLDFEMQKLDFSKQQKELEKAMKQLDEQKISAQVDASLKSVDWSQINKQIDESIAKVNKVQMDEVRKQIEKVKVQLEDQRRNFHFEAPKIDAQKIKAETKNALQNAKKSIKKAKAEIKNMKEFTDALQSDGLIDKSKAYKVEVKGGELYINGNKQSKEVSEKYKRFYQKDNFTIDMNKKNDIKL